MDAAAEPIRARPARPAPEVMAAPEPPMADAVRAIVLDMAATAAASGTAAPLTLPMGMAEAATVLWTRFHAFDAADPHWPDRDRFVLSAGHGAALLYALLHLTGHAGLGVAELRGFGAPHAPTAAQPEFGAHPAVEATAGPPGQGLAAAVGMALAERLLAARFGRSLVDHRTWVVACDADLAQGISHESACLAGWLRLERLTVLWHDTGAMAGDEPLRRFTACGWATRRVPGHDTAALVAALSLALRSKKPTLIACRTAIDAGDAAAARAAMIWPHPPFAVPEGLAERWRAAGAGGARRRRGWLKRLARHPQRAEFERVMAGQLPAAFREIAASLRTGLAADAAGLATEAAGRRVLEALAPALPELAGTALRPVRAGTPAAHASVSLAAGTHGMAAAMNGLALHGGVIPCGTACLTTTDAMRPAVRLAGQMRRRVIHVLTQEPAGGIAGRPAEHLAALRAISNLFVFRPADALETAECWELALRRADGPSVLVLSAETLPPLRGDAVENRSARGGYVLAEADGPRQVTLIASGAEVGVAIAARAVLAQEGIAAAVVSLPCWELFALADPTWRDAVLGGVPRIGVEAGSSFGWDRWLGPGGLFVGPDGGAAGGLTAAGVAALVRRRLAAAA
jgi:transketolase